MSQLDLFFQAGLQDQLAIAGQEVTLCARGSAPVVVQGVLTERSDGMQVEVGESVRTLNAHLLIPLTAGVQPLPGMAVRANGNNYTVFGVTRSQHEAAWACDLSANY